MSDLALATIEMGMEVMVPQDKWPEFRPKAEKYARSILCEKGVLADTIKCNVLKPDTGLPASPWTMYFWGECPVSAEPPRKHSEVEIFGLNGPDEFVRRSIQALAS